jgi:hypothetical protein
MVVQVAPLFAGVDQHVLGGCDQADGVVNVVPGAPYSSLTVGNASGGEVGGLA